MKFQLWKPIKPFIITQKFGENSEYYSKNIPGLKAHNGLDCLAVDSQLIYATHDGIVTFTGEDGKGGLGVVVRITEKYEYKIDEVYFKTIYWHCKPNGFRVKPGDLVKTGDILAEADNTGFSTNTHLHWGLKPVQKTGEADWMWLNYESGDEGYFGAIDPAPFLNGYYAIDAPLVKKNLETQISLLQKIINLLTTLLGGRK